MTENAFDRIDEALRAGGPDAGFDVMVKQALDEKNYPLLFEIRLLKKRHDLGLPLIQVEDPQAMDPETRRAYEAAYIEAAREVGGLFLADGNIQRAWLYLRAIGEIAPITQAIDKLEFKEGMEPIIEIAYMERAHPYKGFQMILSQYGICRAITSFGQFPSREGRPESLRLLVRTLYEEVVERLTRVITAVEGTAPTGTKISELIAGRDSLFEDGSCYVDTSHLISVIRFSIDLDDPETLALAEELAEYGTHLKSPYQEQSDPPFDNFYVDYGMYFRALQRKNDDEAIAHFRKKIDLSDPAETGSMPAQVLVGLLARFDRYAEAIEISEQYLKDVKSSELTCPSVIQLCFAARDFERLGKIARERTDVLSYAAQALTARQ